MLAKLFSRPKKEPLPSVYKTPEGESAYVIGDIHGCYDKMVSLLDNIDAHAEIHCPQGYTVVFLGDLIDRGPQSKEVVEHLMGFDKRGIKTVFLMGNHEEVFLDVLSGDARKLTAWFDFGGRDCLRSYGVDNLGEIHMNPDSLLYRAQNKVPQAHIDFIQGFENYFVFGDYICVHAGLRPGKPLEQQSVRDMRWIRKSFLEHTKPGRYKIVHGHSIVESAADFGNRIAVDTGGYDGGPLSAVFLQGEQQAFITSA